MNKSGDWPTELWGNIKWYLRQWLVSQFQCHEKGDKFSLSAQKHLDIHLYQLFWLTLAANAYKNHAYDPRRWTQTDLPNTKKVCFWLDMYRILTAPSINKPEAWFSDSGQAYSDFTEFNPSMKDYVAVVTTTLVILKFYFSMSNTAGSVSDPKRPTTRKKLTDRTKKQDHIISHRHSNDTV